MIKFAKKHVALCFLILTLFGSGCRGYEDGPVVSMRTVKKRLCDGRWALDFISIDGVENTKFADSILIGHGEEFQEVSFEIDPFNDDLNAHMKAKSGRLYPGLYYLSEDKSEIAFTLGTPIQWYDIKRLTSTQFRVQSKLESQPSVYISLNKSQ